MSQSELRVEYVPTSKLHMYKNNANKHSERQVEQIASSIEEFEFASPILAWHNEKGQAEIVAGHGRFMAARKLGLKRLPVIFLDYLTDEQRKAFGLVENQLNRLSEFDFDALQVELSEITTIDMGEFDFDIGGDWFDTHERNDTSREEGNDEYNEFLDKFEAKKTTDDCYTPDLVYDAVLNWVREEYGIGEDVPIIRPFYPNGDYEREKYPDGCVVVDNPPFSIMTEILRFYVVRGIRFFLFAPTLTLFTGRGLDICYLPVGVGVTYENGASVNTSFITNLENHRIHVRPSLYDVVSDANKRNTNASRKELPKYDYPSHVVTSASLSRYAVHGVEFVVEPDECQRVSTPDAMKASGKQAGIFGGGFLLSDGAAKRNEEADAKKEHRKRQAMLQRLASAADGKGVDARADGTIVWKLSDRELAIIERLGRHDV